LSLLAFELDSHSQFDIIKLFLRSSFVLIPSYLEFVVDEEVKFGEALDKWAF
jgi:hypothetical protein